MSNITADMKNVLVVVNNKGIAAKIGQLAFLEGFDDSEAQSWVKVRWDRRSGTGQCDGMYEAFTFRPATKRDVVHYEKTMLASTISNETHAGQQVWAHTGPDATEMVVLEHTVADICWC